MFLHSRTNCREATGHTFSATVKTSVPALMPDKEDAVMIFTLAGILHTRRVSYRNVIRKLQ